VSHATEGDLHAYLDGGLQDLEPERAAALRAHLQACSDCRARLSEERRWRDGAIDLLGSVAPTAGEPPPFEDVLAAAAAGPSEGSTAGSDGGFRGAVVGGRPPGRLIELAWAASIVIALGAGWMGRSMMTETGELERLAALEQNPVRADAPAERAIPSSVGEAKGQRENEPGVAGERSTEPAETAKRDEAFDGTVEDAEQTPAESAREKLTQSPPQAAALDADAAAVVAEVTEERTLGEEETPATESETDRVEGQAALADDVSGADAGFARTRLDAIGAVFESDLSWMPVSRADAEHWLSHELLTVPQLPIVELAISSLEDVRLVRVTHRLPSGSVLEVVEQAVDPAWGDEVGGRLRNERATLTAPKRMPADSRRQEGVEPATAVTAAVVEGLYVSVRAPVAPDSLAELVSRLRR